MDRLTISFCLILFCIAGCKQTEPMQKAEVKTQPENVRFITSDIDRFWQMFDAETPLFTAKEVEDQYFYAGTPALALFYEEKIKTPDTLTDLLNSWLDRMYYEDVRENTFKIHSQKEQVIHALKTFQELYPNAVFTDIVFVIGTLSTGGVVLPNGQIVIAAEMYAKSEDTDIEYLSSWHQSVLRTPDALPAIIIHELVHLQQQKFALENNMIVGGRTLLDRALLEGSADFITYLVVNNSLNERLLAYGNPKEETLWNRFKKKMHQRDFSNWLYNGRGATDEPADLGYYIGFKIAQHFYKNASDKKKAIMEIMQMKDGQSFLRQSGYADSFE